MRYVRYFVLAMLVCAAGCDNPKRTSRQNLTEKIDVARRLFNHATSLMANPLYFDRTTGKRSPVRQQLLKEDVGVPATQPIDNPDAVAKLQEASGILVKAISDNPEAPVGTVADAHHLLGEIQLALGRYHFISTDRIESKASVFRMSAQKELALIRINLISARFGQALAGLPRDKIVSLRDDAAGSLKKLGDEIKTIDRKTSSLTGQNVKLGKANEKMLNKARKMSDDSEVMGGPKGLELFKKAKALDAEANKNANTIAANQQAVEVLKFNRIRLRQKHRNAELRLAAVNKHLKGMDKQGAEATIEAKNADQRISESQKEVERLTGKIVKCNKDLTVHEKQAVSALEKAQKHLNQAEKFLRKEISTARAIVNKSDKPNSLVEGLLDDNHLTLIISAKGSAGLVLGDLYSRQITTAGANNALADGITEVRKMLGREAPPSVKSLKGYLADPVKTGELARAAYKQVEKDLGVILKSHLKRGAGRNTVWMCQAQLANAYLGHFRLTGQDDILDKANELVAEALHEKEDSSCMKSVKRLQQSIQSARQ